MAEGGLLEVTADEVHGAPIPFHSKRQPGRTQLPQVQSKFVDGLAGNPFLGRQLNLGYPRCDLPGDGGPDHCLGSVLLVTVLFEEGLATTFIKLNLHHAPPLSDSSIPGGSAEIPA